MYTQRRPLPEGGAIPQNYSGNAFRYPPIGALGQEAEIDQEPPKVSSFEQDACEEPKERSPVLLEAPVPQLSNHTGRSSLLGEHGIGSEELLLLGLCLLLSGNGGLFSSAREKGDVVPYLLLLLILG